MPTDEGRATVSSRLQGAFPAGERSLCRLAAARPLRVAAVVALVFFASRAYRADWPPAMYFDEHYYARSAYEALAGVEPTNNEHPHLAKYLMALGIRAFGDERVAGSEPLPADVTALAADVNGTIVYGRADGEIVVRPRGADEGTYARAAGPVRGIALDGRRVLYRTATRVGDFYNRAPGEVAERGIDFPDGVRDALALGGWTLVATPRELVLYAPGLAERLRVPLADVVALTVRPDFVRAYALTGSGSVFVVDLVAGEIIGEVRTSVRASAIAYSWGQREVLLADAERPIIWRFEEKERLLAQAPLANARVGAFSGGVHALAMDPATDLAYVALDDAVVVFVPRAGVAAARFATPGVRWLAVDGARAQMLAGAPGSATRLEVHDALAWRLPGLLAGALLAFFAVLLAHRLFGPRAALLFGALLLLDGTTFAQPRMALLDVYATAGLVAAWYFVAVAIRPRSWRGGAIACLAAGASLGFGAAAKWSVLPGFGGVALVSLVITARSRGRDPSAGPLDLLGRRGRNALLLFVAFVALPLALYVLSYLPWFGLGHGLADFVGLQQEILGYHADFAPTPHDLASRWWTWPLLIKPLHIWGASAVGGREAAIYDIGNPLLFWAGVAALPFAAWELVRRRHAGLALVALGFALVYAPWAFTPRTEYFYYFFTATPFFLLLLAHALDRLASRRRGRAVVTGFLVAAAALFAFWYPVLSGVPVPREWRSAYLWLPTWRDECRVVEPLACAERLRPEELFTPTKPADVEGVPR